MAFQKTSEESDLQKSTASQTSFPSASTERNKWKIAFFILLFVWFTTAGVVILLSVKLYKQSFSYLKKISPTPENFEKVVNPPKLDNCIMYGSMEITQFLHEYTVKPGDTLLSIASSQLDDPSRSTEIIALNNYLRRYPELSLENPFLEVGWRLFMPPKNVKQTSGNIQAYAGEITEVNPDHFVVGFSGGGGGRISYTHDTQFLLKEKDEYQLGDCLFQIIDVRSEGVRSLYILPLTKEALSNFKTLTTNQ